MDLRKFKNATSEIKSLNNDLLIVGKIIGMGNSPSFFVDVAIKSEKSMAKLPFGMPVKISLKEGKHFIVLGGFIAETDENKCRVNKLNDVTNIERRKFFRIRAHAAGNVVKHDDVLIDELDASTFTSKLIDISLSGVKFSSEAVFSETDLIDIKDLHLIKSDLPFNFKCRIIDKQQLPNRNVYIYRCSIEDMQQKENDRLSKAIFELQRESIKRQKAR